MSYRIALRPDARLQGGRPGGELDDVVVKDVSMFRAEMMDDKSLWMCCYFPDSGERISFWVRATKRKGQMRLEFHVTEEPRGPEFTFEDQ